MAPVTEDEVLRVASAVGFDVPESELGDYTELLDRAQAAFEAVVNCEGAHVQGTRPTRLKSP